jgi:hypothetical protein
MGWSSTGRYIADDPLNVQQKTALDTGGVDTQTQQLSGLLRTSTPTAVTNDSGMGPAVKPADATTTTTTPTQTVNDSGMGPVIKPATTTPAQPAVPAFTPPAPTPTPAGPSMTPPPSNYQLPGAPTPEDASVETRLSGLLASDSPYIRAARLAGERQANARGLLNSSIAAGNSEAAAIAAAAPIASQDAAQIAQRNQTNLESWNQLRNATTVQQLTDNAAWQRQAAQLTNALDLQGMSDTSAMSRLIAQGNIQAAIQQMQDSNALTQTQINANVALIGNYMTAFSALAQNPDVPASARDAYMGEYLRVTQQGQALTNALAGISVTWPGGGGPVTTGGGTTPVTGGEFYNGPSKSEIMAMQHDGTPGNYAAAVAEWNKFHPEDKISSGSSGNFLSNTFPSQSGLGLLGSIIG